MSELIQENKKELKYLTIDEIMPTWSHFLDLYIEDVKKAMKFKIKNSISIMDPERCFVGESWKFSDKYAGDCKECQGFSYGRYTNKPSFTEVYSDVIHGEIKNWREHPRIQEFVTHFNEKHVCLT